jgi:hypothetical protein
MNGKKLYHFRPKEKSLSLKNILSNIFPAVAENRHLKGHTLSETRCNLKRRKIK